MILQRSVVCGVHVHAWHGSIYAHMKMAAKIAKSLHTVDREIGRGEHCVVYEGELNGNPVAIKKIADEALAGSGPLFFELFLQAGSLLMQLSHPHIVKILEVNQSRAEGPAIVMERLDQDLDKVLELHRGNLSHERQIAMCLQIADAVHYLHSQQPPVVYRYLTAKNVLISQDGVLKLGETSEAARLPHCGFFDECEPGAIPYLPPEALEFECYDMSIDIFSLGMLMLEIATQHVILSRLPKFSTVPESKLQSDHLSLLPEDHPLKPIILQCLRDDPRARPNSGAILRMLSEGEASVWLLSTYIPISVATRKGKCDVIISI